MTKLVEIEGIGQTYATKLQSADIATLEKLLDRGSTKKGRKEIEETTGISSKLVLRWINMADLFRIKGIGEQYSDLLEAAGVDTVPELAQRKAENLHKKMAEVNEAKKLVRAAPSLSAVVKWVDEAKQLPRIVTY
ncbi:MAG: DUF4332 domain-containing protein [Candidatus Thiodiazotropha sp. (ex Dulcina madagascariensis)]|nr:DUF4332 domain-containing protein [Candidatus Thiodiazotropha sp. (ex Epidulcina cf. delphinae)]MCU7935414.1 DUF4332 domain-containing protein [Candidatus Thiodiazotropha sp. (ex Dulcina madagascariensis)]